jgi:cytoskeletal protein CcmA (bactofilin family)
MDNQNQPITESDSLETPIDAPDKNGVVEAPQGQAGNGVISPGQKRQSEGEDKRKGLKHILNGVNLYFILLFVVLIILGAISYYAVVQNRKAAKATVLNTQKLTQDALDKLAGTDSTVGDPKQTLSIESNAIFTGGVIIRGNIDVAGTLKVGGPLSLPGLSVGGTTNLDQAAVKNLTDSGNASIQGKVTIQNGLSVSGGATFNGTVSATQISADTLQLNKDLQLAHHLTLTGSTPGRTNGSALGSGGTASISGTDTAGNVVINTGSGAPAGCFVTLTFVSAFANIPHVIITPSSSAAAGVSYYVNRTPGNFSICTASDPPDNTSGMSFDYIIVG